MQDQLVPGDVHHLGRHRDHPLAGQATQQQVFAQAVEDALDLFLGKVRIAFANRLGDPWRQAQLPDETQAPAVQAATVEIAAGERGAGQQGDAEDSHGLRPCRAPPGAAGRHCSSSAWFSAVSRTLL
ncbi:hypothetical protein IHMA87_05754 [Pseudomonas paraeruginosa]|nr:hypothetical protein IHMA87_05754 [Pseudomonas aeruginosa]